MTRLIPIIFVGMLLAFPGIALAQLEWHPKSEKHFAEEAIEYEGQRRAMREMPTMPTMGTMPTMRSMDQAITRPLWTPPPPPYGTPAAPAGMPSPPPGY